MIANAHTLFPSSFISLSHTQTLSLSLSLTHTISLPPTYQAGCEHQRGVTVIIMQIEINIIIGEKKREEKRGRRVRE